MTDPAVWIIAWLSLIAFTVGGIVGLVLHKENKRNVACGVFLLLFGCLIGWGIAHQKDGFAVWRMDTASNITK